LAKKGKGWHGESDRHSKAAKGIKTTSNKNEVNTELPYIEETFTFKNKLSDYEMKENVLSFIEKNEDGYLYARWMTPPEEISEPSKWYQPVDEIDEKKSNKKKPKKKTKKEKTKVSVEEDEDEDDDIEEVLYVSSPRAPDWIRAPNEKELEEYNKKKEFEKRVEEEVRMYTEEDEDEDSYDLWT